MVFIACFLSINFPNFLPSVLGFWAETGPLRNNFWKRSSSGNYAFNEGSDTLFANVSLREWFIYVEIISFWMKSPDDNEIMMSAKHITSWSPLVVNVHSWSFAVNRGHSCVTFDTTYSNDGDAEHVGDCTFTRPQVCSASLASIKNDNEKQRLTWTACLLNL